MWVKSFKHFRIPVFLSVRQSDGQTCKIKGLDQLQKKINNKNLSIQNDLLFDLRSFENNGLMTPHYQDYLDEWNRLEILHQEYNPEKIQQLLSTYQNFVKHEIQHPGLLHFAEFIYQNKEFILKPPFWVPIAYSFHQMNPELNNPSNLAKKMQETFKDPHLFQNSCIMQKEIPIEHIQLPQMADIHLPKMADIHLPKMADIHLPGDNNVE